METSLIIDINKMPEYMGAKEKQEALVKENPFQEVTDNTTYEVAKKRRTSLRQGRFDLQNGEKAIIAKLREFREYVKTETETLIGITLPHEEIQQVEIDDYEKVKKKEKEERQRQEDERILRIQSAISEFLHQSTIRINAATLEDIDKIIAGIKESSLEAEEFSNYFNSVKTQLEVTAYAKEAQLKREWEIKEEREAIEAERKLMEAERIKQEEKSRIENAKMEAERKSIQAEKDRIAKEVAEKKAAIEAAEKAKLDAEQKVKEEAERKVKEELEKRANIEHQKAFKDDVNNLRAVFYSLSYDDCLPLIHNESRELLESFVQEVSNLSIKYINLIEKL